MDIYNFLPEKKAFEQREDSRYLCYGQFKMLHKVVDPKDKKGGAINVSKAKSGTLYFGIMMLSKQLIQKTDEVNYELCQKITPSKKMQKWMDFNYLYIFDFKKVKNQEKANDEIFPYEEKIDLADWNEIQLLDTSMMGFCLKSSKEQLYFLFENVVECVLFYRFCLKAKKNILEQYAMKKQKVVVNLDFCELFIY